MMNVSPERRQELVTAIRGIRAQRSQQRNHCRFHYGRFPDYTLKRLLKFVEDATQIGPRDFAGGSLFRHHAAARHLAMWLMARYTAHSYRTISILLGVKDMKSAAYGIDRVEKVVQRNRADMPAEDACPTQWAHAIWEVWGFADYKPGG